MTEVFSSASTLMNLETLSLCFMSRYDVISSKMYTSAFFKTVAAIATLCNSPPDMLSILLLSIGVMSSCWAVSSSLFFSSTFFNSSFTVPLNV